MKTAIAIRHIQFEDLGTLEPILHAVGYKTKYVEAAAGKWDDPQLESADLLMVLGAPIGAHDEKIYPFLTQELRCIERRIKDRRPLLGICLGAQLMARVLGASVAPMKSKEIGFSAIQLTPAGRTSALAALPENTAVLHWHGDQFSIPKGAESLAGTNICPNQAFAIGNHALGLQFHLEADTDKIEHWLLGHATELSQAGVDPRVIREQAKAHGAKLKIAAEAVFNRWLDGFDRSRE